MRRFFGITAGLVVQLLFAVTSYFNYVFLQGRPPRPGNTSLMWDGFLALQFGLVHSLLLWPGVKKRLGKVISPAFYGLFFCTAACLTLSLTMWQWQVGDWAIWQLRGGPRFAVQTMYLACWGTLFYSLCCSGFGYHTGWLPWWYWVQQKAIAPRPFKPRGAFSVIRHPGYMSFLGLIWLTPDMTSDRALLVAIWTVYIFLGSQLKDRRMRYYLGATYRQYQAEVPAYMRGIRSRRAA
jgi:methanethiol S-methyltransferase